MVFMAFALLSTASMAQTRVIITTGIVSPYGFPPPGYGYAPQPVYYPPCGGGYAPSGYYRQSCGHPHHTYNNNYNNNYGYGNGGYGSRNRHGGGNHQRHY